MELSQNTLLQGGKYRIIRTLGQGGFGITYLAEHTTLGSQVCIKEFFLKDYCNREANGNVLSIVSDNSNVDIKRYKQKFLDEARKVSQIKHTNIVGVSDLFEENGTAYFVMDYIDGESLSSRIRRVGTLDEQCAKRYVAQAASALSYIHARNILHLDIKPANIMVRAEDDSIVLIDFGLAKHYDAETGNQTTTLLAACSPGYAPFEQGLMGGGIKMFCPATDIYALGATLYTMVTGECPPEAATIPSEGLPELPATLSVGTRSAIVKSMEYAIKNRPQSIDEFMTLLGNEVSNIESKNLKPQNEETIIKQAQVAKPAERADADKVQQSHDNNPRYIARAAVKGHFDEASKCGFMIGTGRGHKVVTDIKVDGKLIATIASERNILGVVTIYAKTPELTMSLTNMLKRCKHYEIRANEKKVFGNKPDVITSLIADYITEIDANISSNRVEILNYEKSNRQLLWVLASLPIAGGLYCACMGIVNSNNFVKNDEITVVCGSAILPVVIAFAMFMFYKYSTREFAIKNKLVDLLFVVITSFAALSLLYDGAQIPSRYFEDGCEALCDYDYIDNWKDSVRDQLYALYGSVNIYYYFIFAIYTVIKSVLLYREFGKSKSFAPIYILLVCSVAFFSIFIAYIGGGDIEGVIVAPIAMFLICSIVYACIKPVRVNKIKA